MTAVGKMMAPGTAMVSPDLYRVCELLANTCGAIVQYMPAKEPFKSLAGDGVEFVFKDFAAASNSIGFRAAQDSEISKRTNEYYWNETVALRVPFSFSVHKFEHSSPCPLRQRLVNSAPSSRS